MMLPTRIDPPMQPLAPAGNAVYGDTVDFIAIALVGDPSRQHLSFDSHGAQAFAMFSVA